MAFLDTLAPYQHSIEGQETFLMEGIGLGASVDSQTTFTFHLRRVSQENAVISPKQQKTVADSPAINAFSWTGENVSVVQDESATPAVTRELVEKELKALKELLEAGRAGTREHVEAMESLYKHTRSDDVTVDAILARLPDELPASDYAATLVGTLGAVGTPAAQAALLDIVTRADWPADQREMAFEAFIQVTEPIPGIEDRLMAIHMADKEYADKALLIMAAMADRLGTTDPTRFERISEYVLAYADTKGLQDNEVVMALNAIGNLGPPDVPQSVQKAIKSEDVIIRQSAVESLQRISSEEASTQITQAILHDSSDAVRLSAAKLLADTNRSGAVDVLRQVIANDKSDEVRKKSIASLDAWYDHNLEVALIIKNSAEQDASEEVRALARQLLESHVEEKNQ